MVILDLSVWLMSSGEVKCFPETLWYSEICLLTCLFIVHYFSILLYNKSFLVLGDEMKISEYDKWFLPSKASPPVQRQSLDEFQ